MTPVRAYLRRLAVALCVPLAIPLAAVGPTPARAAVASCPEVDRTRRATLVVDTSALEEGAPVVQERVREGLAVTLRDLEILPAKQASAPVLRVEIWQLGADDFRYGFAITLERGEARRVEFRHSGECDACTEGEIVSRVLEAVEGLAADLCAATEQGDAAPAQTVDDASVDDEPPPPPPRLDPEEIPRDDEALSTLPPAPAPARRPLGAAGKGGLAAVVVGAAAVGVGTALALRAPIPLDDRPLYVRNTQPPGIAVASAGAGVVLTGVILLIVDRVRAGRPRSSTYATRVGRGGPR
jgi:hypothetical protein